ncbi:MAG: DUF1559 domain-containing protein [Pirellulales bacterium]
MSDPFIAAQRLRRGFTLVELLVVIAVIALILMLVIPSIQSPRISAFKNSCRNNVKQLGLALLNHQDTYRTFPPLVYSGDSKLKGNLDAQTVEAADLRYSFNVRLLPFIEEDSLYKQISKASTKFSQDPNSLRVTNSGVSGEVHPGAIRLSGFICPGFSGETESGGFAASNYVALAATTEGKLTPQGAFDPDDAKNTQLWNVEPDGMVIPDRLARGQPMARMKDGTSKTCVLAESREGVLIGGGAKETSQNAWYKASQSYVYAFPPSLSPGTNDVGFDARGNFTTSAKTAINYGPSVQSPGAVYKSSASPGPAPRNWGPSSDHQGGIVVHAMGDGSVQEITTDVDPGAYYSAITVAGGETLTLP